MNKNKMSLQPEVYDLIVADIKKANENISHEKFIKGAKNGTMGFRGTTSLPFTICIRSPASSLICPPIFKDSSR